MTTICNNVALKSSITEPWVYWDDCFTDLDLDNIITYGESLEHIQATIIGCKDIEISKQVRISNVTWIKKEPNISWLFDKINYIFESANNHFYGMNIIGYDSIQYTTYDDVTLGRYDWHMDSCLGTIINNGETRKLSMSILLNDNFEGVNLKLIQAKKKMQLIFQ